MLVLICMLVLVSKDCEWLNTLYAFLCFLLKVAFLTIWCPWEGRKHGWTQLWSELWDRLWVDQVVHRCKGMLLISPGKLNLHKEEWFLCTSYFSLSFYGGGCGLETSDTHHVWKGVHQCRCVSHEIKCCQQRCTTDAALFSCGPSEGERWTDTKNAYVHSCLLSWFVCFQRAVTACQTCQLFITHSLPLALPASTITHLTHQWVWFASSKRLWGP